MRSRTTVEFLGIWEQLNNPNFKGVEFDSFMYDAGGNSFTLSPSKWIQATNAIGIISKQGNNGGTFAHKDIAFEFASWVSSGFKLYLIKEKSIPPTLSKNKIIFMYADEADMLNMALFGMTAKQWRNENPKEEGNIRDTATIEQLVVLSNMESINSILIHQGLQQSQRLQQLNNIAITQMKSLMGNKQIAKLKK